MTKLVLNNDAVDAETLPLDADPDAPEVGKWFWIADKTSSEINDEDGEGLDEESTLDEEEENEDEENLQDVLDGTILKDVAHSHFCCVTHIGSNFVELKTPFGRSFRVHINQFHKYTLREHDPDKVISDSVARHQITVRQLLGEVQELTRRLGVADMGKSLPGGEVQALAVRGERSKEEIDGYKQALILAKKETLPELFKQIEKANDRMATWMKAPLIPLEADSGGLRKIIKKIEGRVFNVELYAGLVEEVTQISDGEPAPVATPIHLMQRRAYMDEECLIDYEAGGMDFKSMAEFEAWLALPKHRDRILPFPRCVIAFKVRRKHKHREWDLTNFIQIQNENKTDDYTYLYLRNGEQLFCLSTGIEFEEKLFPDLEKTKLEGKLWAKGFDSSFGGAVITDDRYQGMVEDEARKKAIYDALPEDADSHERWKARVNYESHQYTPFVPENVYYDDILRFVQDNIEKHNRVVLILQGLLDRSSVFHPHPPWHLWKDDFNKAVRLVFDDSKALVAGDKPDFEAYRKRLNFQITKGTVTVGQEDIWLLAEGKRETERRQRSWRYRSGDSVERHRPYGNHGPGLLAKVDKFSKKNQTCVFEWTRERLGQPKRYTRSWNNELTSRIAVPRDKLFNVDAYEVGDYKKFFDDPRTREDYLEWAPFLLIAEDYHAGKRSLSLRGKLMASEEETEEGDESENAEEDEDDEEDEDEDKGYDEEDFSVGSEGEEDD